MVPTLNSTHGVAVVRECCNAECGWKGETDRMLGAVGPLCPDCGEVTEPAAGIAGTPAAQRENDEAYHQFQRDRIAEAQRHDAEEAKPKLTNGVKTPLEGRDG